MLWFMMIVLSVWTRPRQVSFCYCPTVWWVVGLDRGWSRAFLLSLEPHMARRRQFCWEQVHLASACHRALGPPQRIAKYFERDCRTRGLPRASRTSPGQRQLGIETTRNARQFQRRLSCILCHACKCIWGPRQAHRSGAGRQRDRDAEKWPEGDTARWSSKRREWTKTDMRELKTVAREKTQREKLLGRLREPRARVDRRAFSLGEFH